MPSELKPCPFCGGEAVLNKDIELDTVGVFCKHCGCGTPYFHSLNLKHAIDRWNRRSEDVVRCKDCGYFHQDKSGGYCDRPFEDAVPRLPDDFCSKGVKKGE